MKPRKQYHRICAYCGEPFVSDVKKQKYCNIKCAKAAANFYKSGTVTCSKCWQMYKIPKYSPKRICEDCKNKRTARTLEMFSSEELLHYGKIQADKYMKERR